MSFLGRVEKTGLGGGGKIAHLSIMRVPIHVSAWSLVGINKPLFVMQNGVHHNNIDQFTHDRTTFNYYIVMMMAAKASPCSVQGQYNHRHDY